MKNILEARRQKLLRELNQVNRQIAETKKTLSRLESRITSLQPRAKAA